MRKMNEKITARTEKDSPPYPDSNSGTRVSSDLGSTTSTPRWAKLVGIIFIVQVLLFVILHLTGHGFGHHMSVGSDGHTTPIEHGVQ